MKLDKDFILRMINDLAKSIAFIVLGKNDIEYELPENNEYSKVDLLYVKLLELVNSGKINEAEDMLFDEINTSDMRQFRWPYLSIYTLMILVMIIWRKMITLEMKLVKVLNLFVKNMVYLPWLSFYSS